MPALTEVLSGGTVLYLTPTKALAADQLRSVANLGLDGVRAATFDGDTPLEERAWVRRNANYVLTNPDMLHRSMLPRHSAWTSFWRRLRLVIVDECHGYRGVFGPHVAQILPAAAAGVCQIRLLPGVLPGLGHGERPRRRRACA